MDYLEAEKEALFAQPQNSEDLADKIEWVITHPEQASTIAAAGQQKVKRTFYVKRSYSVMKEVYEQP